MLFSFSTISEIKFLIINLIFALLYASSGWTLINSSVIFRNLQYHQQTPLHNVLQYLMYFLYLQVKAESQH